jgi:hypothetical protein
MRAWIRKHRTGAFLLAVLALAGIGGILVFFYFTYWFTLGLANAPGTVRSSRHGVSAAYLYRQQSALSIRPLVEAGGDGRVFGTMTFGDEWAGFSQRRSTQGIRRLFARPGVNFIDTANFYTNGTSESVLGKFTRDHRRSVVLATKYTTKYSMSVPGADPNAAGNPHKNMIHSVEASRKRLQTDYIDLYWSTCGTKLRQSRKSCVGCMISFAGQGARSQWQAAC